MAMKKTENKTVEIMEIKKGWVDFCILGVTPLITEAMSQKFQIEILDPNQKSGKKGIRGRKHNPLGEFRGSMYTTKDGPTLVYIPAVSFKKSMASSALDLDGATKSQIARSIWIPHEYAHIYGVPKLRMDVVRCADIARTPDIRTRACFAEWACRLTVTFPIPLLNETQITHLLAAAGMTRGVGGFRPEKGAGDFGQFELVSPDDERYQRIVATGGREAQVAAYDSPETWDEETAALLAVWHENSKLWGFEVAS